MAVGPGESTGPQQSLVVLGASNVTRSISTVVETAQWTMSRPVDLFIVAGLGRSYGMETWVLGRSLPSILDCGVWERLRRAEVPPSSALLTDIGNDLIFGASPRTIAGWVERCVDRLSSDDCPIVITRLPLESISSLSRARFLIIRNLMFPSSRLTYEFALEGSQELDERVQEIATKRNLSTVRPQRNWYGVDPIHIRQTSIRPAWKFFFSAFDQPESNARTPSSRLVEHWRLKFSCPHERKIFGVRQARQQPALSMRDGSRVSFY